MIRVPLDRSRRATALLAVLLLLFPSVGEALGHACPHHGPGGAVHSAAEGAAAAAEGHHAAAGHDSRVEAPAPGGHEGPCTCVGTCEAGSLPVLAPVDAGVLPLHTTAVLGPTPPEASGRVRFPAHFLPYSQGPPPIC